MGYLTAVDAIERMGDDQALEYHLQHNLFPPVPLVFEDMAKKAIKLAARSRWDVKLSHPFGGKETVARTVKCLHLEAFVESVYGKEKEESNDED